MPTESLPSRNWNSFFMLASVVMEMLIFSVAVSQCDQSIASWELRGRYGGKRDSLQILEMKVPMNKSSKFPPHLPDWQSKQLPHRFGDASESCSWRTSQESHLPASAIFPGSLCNHNRIRCKHAVHNPRSHDSPELNPIFWKLKVFYELEHKSKNEILKRSQYLSWGRLAVHL